MIKFINKKKLLKITAFTLSMAVLVLLPFTFLGSTEKSITKSQNKLNNKFQPIAKKKGIITVRNQETNIPKKTKTVAKNLTSSNRYEKQIEPRIVKLSNMNKMGSYLTPVRYSVDEYTGLRGKNLNKSLLNRNTKYTNIRIYPHTYISEFRYDFIIYPNKLSVGSASEFPLGLTSGISNAKVNAIVPSVPEPHEYFMLMIGLAMVYFRLRSCKLHLKVRESRPYYV